MKLFLLSDDNDTIMGMRLAGVEGRQIDSVDEFMEYYTNAKQEDIGILLITYSVKKMLGEQLNVLKKNNFPLIVEIPDSNPDHLENDSISKYLSDAIGITI